MAPKTLSPGRVWLLAAAGLGALLGLALLLASVPDVPVEALLPSYANGASKFLELQGVRVHYRDEGHGPPLVLLHGTGASLHTWDAWTAALSPTHRVLRMDLPGFGLTGPNRTGDYSVKGYVAFVESFREALGLGRFALAGNSLGGQIAWNYAVAYPQQLTELILVDPAGFKIARPALVFRLARVPLLSTLLSVLDPGPMVRKSLRDAYGDASKVTPELLERYRRLALREGNRAAFIARARQPEPDRTADLSRISTPTLVLWGAEDRLIPVADAERFASAIPGAQLRIYPGVGHVPMEEIGARSAADVEAFLAAARAPP